MLQNFYKKNVVGHWDSIYYNCMSLCIKTQAMGIRLMSMKNMMGELLYFIRFLKNTSHAKLLFKRLTCPKSQLAHYRLNGAVV